MDPELIRVLNQVAEILADVGESLKTYATAQIADPFTPSYNQDGTLTEPTDDGSLTAGERARWVSIAGIFSKEMGFEKDMFRFKPENVLGKDPLRVIITGIELDEKTRAKKADDEPGAISKVLGGIAGTLGGLGGALGGGAGFLGGLSAVGIATAGAIGGITALTAGIFGIGKAIEFIDTEKFLNFISGLADIAGGKLRNVFDYLFQNKDNIIELFERMALPMAREYIGLFNAQLDRLFNLVISAGGGAKDIIVEIIDTLEKLGLKTLEEFGSTIRWAVMMARDVITDRDFLQGAVIFGETISRTIILPLMGLNKVFGEVVRNIGAVLSNETFNRTLREFAGRLVETLQALWGPGSVLTTAVEQIPAALESLADIIANIFTGVVNIIGAQANVIAVSIRSMRKELVELANIDGRDLLDTAAGITAIYSALTLQSLTTPISTITSTINRLTGNQGPIKALKDLGDTSPYIQATANALQRVFDLLKGLNNVRVVLPSINSTELKEQISNIRDDIEAKLKIKLDTPLTVDMNMDDVVNIIKKTSRVKAQLLDTQVSILKQNNEILLALLESFTKEGTSPSALALLNRASTSNTFSTKDTIRLLTR